MKEKRKKELEALLPSQRFYDSLTSPMQRREWTDTIMAIYELIIRLRDYQVMLAIKLPHEDERIMGSFNGMMEAFEDLKYYVCSLAHLW